MTLGTQSLKLFTKAERLSLFVFDVLHSFFIIGCTFQSLKVFVLDTFLIVVLLGVMHIIYALLR